MFCSVIGCFVEEVVQVAHGLRAHFPHILVVALAQSDECLVGLTCQRSLGTAFVLLQAGDAAAYEHIAVEVDCVGQLLLLLAEAGQLKALLQAGQPQAVP